MLAIARVKRKTRRRFYIKYYKKQKQETAHAHVCNSLGLLVIFFLQPVLIGVCQVLPNTSLTPLSTLDMYGHIDHQLNGRVRLEKESRVRQNFWEKGWVGNKNFLEAKICQTPNFHKTQLLPKVQGLIATSQ